VRPASLPETQLQTPHSPPHFQGNFPAGLLRRLGLGVPPARRRHGRKNGPTRDRGEIRAISPAPGAAGPPRCTLRPTLRAPAEGFGPLFLREIWQISDACAVLKRAYHSISHLPHKSSHPSNPCSGISRFRGRRVATIPPMQMDLCFSAPQAMHNLDSLYALKSQSSVLHGVTETIQNRDGLVILPLPPGLIRERFPQGFCHQEQVRVQQHSE
jgi:hypothetical protein